MAHGEIQIGEVCVAEKETFLTNRQIQILTLREKGLTQVEIAEKLGTTRANINTVEKSARRNIEKAKNTLKIISFIRAPIRINIEQGTDLREVSKMIFSEADKYDLRIPHSGPELLRIIKSSAPSKVREWRIIEPLKIGVTREGEVIIE